jgi:hypothetical protein
VTISVYTGSQVWEGRPRIGAKRGRVAEGPGLYFTTSREVARTYAKGRRTLLRVELDPSLVWLEDALVPTDVVVRWVEQQRGMRAKKQIIADILRNADRLREKHPGMVRANVLLNLMVNYEVASGDRGIALAEFFTSLGISASHVSKFDEDWIVLFDPSKVVSWRLATTDDPWDMPRLKRTSR